MKKLTRALLVALTLTLAFTATAVTAPDADAGGRVPYCVGQAGLTLGSDGVIDISGMPNWQWEAGYASVASCYWGTYAHLIIDIHEDGFVDLSTGGWDCIPYTACTL